MSRLPLIAALLLGACESREAGAPDQPVPANAATAAAAPAPQEPAAPAAAQWDLQSSGEGTALVLAPPTGAAAIRLFCPSGRKRLLVNVPGFRPTGSEERLSFGSGGEVVALVADTLGDAARGGVSGTGPTPGELARLIEGRVSASYGAQMSGPHAAPPPGLARAFTQACIDAAAPGPNSAAQPAAGGACLEQDGQRLTVKPLRALGTEPFWSARIEGRCVTYSHPEDQQGTRVWTRYSRGPGGGGTWAGALGGRRFELRARPEADCSDGMSDRRYPMAVELIVQDERRLGCAEPV